MYDDDSTSKSADGAQNLVDDTRRVAADLRNLYDNVRRDNAFGTYYAQNPYAVLAAAAGIGYVIGGGLFSPFTRRLLRVGMKALVVPLAATQIKNFTGQQSSQLNGGTQADF
ncbi:MAG: hypothetical protein H0U74_09570 [Bradymonadaceae bacterium]|nr:hypothetical protein [Lujinxingiaceae bacterium]